MAPTIKIASLCLVAALSSSQALADAPTVSDVDILNLVNVSRRGDLETSLQPAALTQNTTSVGEKLKTAIGASDCANAAAPTTDLTGVLVDITTSREDYTAALQTVLNTVQNVKDAAETNFNASPWTANKNIGYLLHSKATTVACAKSAGCNKQWLYCELSPAVQDTEKVATDAYLKAVAARTKTLAQMMSNSGGGDGADANSATAAVPCAIIGAFATLAMLSA